MGESWWEAVLTDEDNLVGAEGNFTAIRNTFANHNVNLQVAEDWNWALDLYKKDDTVELSVVGYNRGGLLVEAHNLRGFVPLSHLTAIQDPENERERFQQFASYVGSNLCLKVIELDAGRGRLVFSERAAIAGPGSRIELLAKLSPGMRVSGTVTNLTRFGVFVDLGGVEGLIHVSELSWGRVRHPADVVKCGQELEVVVLSVDREQGRVALSLKELLPDPWEMVEERFKVGEIIKGIVTNVVKFGAFVCIEDGLEGLIHVSELGNGSFLHPRSILHEGEQVWIRIIHIDAAARRLGLSLRDVPQTDTQPDESEKIIDYPETLSSL
jgi:small subunit ribosomal protein S1